MRLDDLSRFAYKRLSHEPTIEERKKFLGRVTCSRHPETKRVRNESERSNFVIRSSGAPGEIRTPDLLLRRQSLYPAELRARARD
jgi:hypothetical protein